MKRWLALSLATICFSARAALAAKLIDSLDTVVDADAEAQWAVEIRRRVAALDAGAPTTPWDEARKLIAAG